VGTYKLAGGQLTVEADVVLAGFCPSEEWSQSRLVVNVFRGELTIEIKRRPYPPCAKGTQTRGYCLCRTELLFCERDRGREHC
jgi:hypothetical protein